ncbi:MAG: TolC family protein [Bacteroidia bacterium]
MNSIKRFYTYSFFLVWSTFLISCQSKQNLPISMLPMQEVATWEALPKPEVFFSDSNLQVLLQAAMRQNPDYLQMQAMVGISRATRDAATGALLPRFEIFAGAARRRFSEYSMDGVGNFDTNFSPNIRPDQRMPNPLPDYVVQARVSWELDIWGKLSAMRKAAAQRYLASEAGLAWQRTVLAADVANTYYELLAFDAMQRIIERNVEVQLDAVNLVKLQQQAGRATALAVQQTEAQWLRTKALGAQIQIQRMRTANALFLLTGSFAEVLHTTTELEVSSSNIDIPEAIPVKWLEKRPDLKQAELELKAAGADVYAARAAFFPSVRLAPEIGQHSFNPATFFDPASLAWQAAAGLTAPVFQQRELKARLRQQEAMQVMAQQAYRKASLQAYNEVYEALFVAGRLQEALDAKAAEVASLQAGVKSSLELYTAGYATYLEVIIAQNDVLAAEMELVQVKLALLQNMVLLYRAVGGSW